MINYIIAGLAGIFIGNEIEKNTLKNKSKDKSKSNSNDKTKEQPLTWQEREKEKPLTWKEWKEEVNSDISSYGMDGAIREGTGWSVAEDVKNKKFQTLRKEYIKNADKLEKYVDNDPVYDTEYEMSSIDVIDKEGFEGAWEYGTWEGVKRKKFHELKDNYLKSKESLEKYLK